MTKESYQKITEPFRRNPKLAQLLHKCNRTATLLVMASYVILLIKELVGREPVLAKTIIIPLNSFIILSVFRYLINRKRPYETFGLEPVIPKKTLGKSFPSRHVFSAFMIAMTYLLATPWPLIGFGILVLAVLIGLIRILSGVHYPGDVLAGIVFAIVAGILGYCLEIG